MKPFRIIRDALLGISLALGLIGTASAFFDETPDQIRIRELEKVATQALLKTADHDGRIIRLEDAVASIKDDLAEGKWWQRGIGGALVLAILERILRTAGVLRRTDGVGPVG